MKVILSLVIVLLSALGSEAIGKCQSCAYTNIASINKNQGDADCKGNPRHTKFSVKCGAASATDSWQCGVAAFTSETGSFLYERQCVRTSDCKDGKVRHVVDGKNMDIKWKCCDDLDNCNHGNALNGNGVLYAAAVAMGLLMRRVY